MTSVLRTSTSNERMREVSGMLPPRPGSRKRDMLRRPVSNAAHWLTIAVLVGAPAALSGCGSATLDHNETPEDPQAPRPLDQTSGLEPVPLTELADRLAAALCQALDSCCHAAALGSSSADCRERTRADY